MHTADVEGREYWQIVPISVVGAKSPSLASLSNLFRHVPSTVISELSVSDPRSLCTQEAGLC